MAPKAPSWRYRGALGAKPNLRLKNTALGSKRCFNDRQLQFPKNPLNFSNVP